MGAPAHESSSRLPPAPSPPSTTQLWMRIQQVALAALAAANINQQDPQRSFEVYVEAAQQILREQPAPAMAEMLKSALGDAARQPDPTQRAWQMRRTLGEVLNEEAGASFVSEGGLPIDFSDPRAAGAWVPVDDRIMGGRSSSRVVFDAAAAAASFEGDLVVEGGGFASVRFSPPFRLPPDIDALQLEARGDGRQGYKLTLRSDAAPPSISYQLQLPPLTGDRFIQLRLPLSDFQPTSRGRPVPDAPPLRARDVRALGLMLSRYDTEGGAKQAIPAGPFQLQIKRISAGESEIAINGRRWLNPQPAAGAEQQKS